MDLLKLIALDEEDLKIVSAHVQDAVTNAGNLEYWKPAKLFVVPMYRFVWENRATLLSSRAERRNSVLNFNRVLSVKRLRIPRDRPQEVLSLLAVRFEETDPPAGLIELVFSGGGLILLEVECIEARLADLGGAWEASSRPSHRV
jgi:hypothetical protein